MDNTNTSPVYTRSSEILQDLRTMKERTSIRIVIQVKLHRCVASDFEVIWMPGNSSKKELQNREERTA